MPYLDTKHRMTLHLPKDLHAKASGRAESKGLSLTAYIITVMDRDLESAGVSWDVIRAELPQDVQDHLNEKRAARLAGE